MRKVKVLAACALGASISFFCDKLVASAHKFGLDLTVETQSVDKVRRMPLESYDIVMVAPHVKFHAQSIRQRAGSTPVVIIDGLAYSTLDTDKVVKESIMPVLTEEKGG